jgi:NAD(P)-dependent dehydrogenase (short-subunit alcohol dehydrogenase family)
MSQSFEERLRAATELLESIAENRELLAEITEVEQRRLLQAAGAVFQPDAASRRRLVKAGRRRVKSQRTKLEEMTLSQAGIRKLRSQAVFTTPNVFPPADFEQREVDDPEFRESTEPQHCYICKQSYSAIHHFYDQLCPPCAEFNYFKRTETADLHGRVALITGGRVKIGYQAGIKLLRAGATVIVTTRFPRNSAERYSREEDFDKWKSRLRIYGLDLRHAPSVEAFCREIIDTNDRLDFIVNNACQTVRRPPEFYQHMMAGETEALHEIPEQVGGLLGSYKGLRDYQLLSASTEELVVPNALFPQGRLDQDLQQVDLRERNSWRLLLAEVSTVELLEVHLVNAIAPFIINARLKPLMMKTPERDKHIVNVSAVEGQFYRRFKTTRHPHTEYGEGGTQYDDANLCDGLSCRRHPYECGGHWLGDR